MHEGIRKLKLDKYAKVGIKFLPEEITAFADLPIDQTVDHPPYDCIVHTVFSLEEMDQTIDWAHQNTVLNPDGQLYFLYPKKGNKRYDSYIHRDSIFTLQINDDGFFKDTDLKLNTMLAFDDVFTACGVKRVPSKIYKKPKISQSVDDYKDRTEEIRQELSPEQLSFYNELTPGYQVGWARYVLSASQQVTKDKRITEMKTAINQGFKSIEMYKEELKKKKG